MEQKDYVEKQIEMMGQFLGRLFSKLAAKDLASAEANEVSREMKEELGLTIDELLQIPEHTFVEMLLDTGMFNAANLEKLADVMFLIAESGSNNTFYARVLMLYEYLENNGKAYSIERNIKISKIRALNSL